MCILWKSMARKLSIHHCSRRQHQLQTVLDMCRVAAFDHNLLCQLPASFAFQTRSDTPLFVKHISRPQVLHRECRFSLAPERLYKLLPTNPQSSLARRSSLFRPSVFSASAHEKNRSSPAGHFQGRVGQPCSISLKSYVLSFAIAQNW